MMMMMMQQRPAPRLSLALRALRGTREEGQGGAHVHVDADADRVLDVETALLQRVRYEQQQQQQQRQQQQQQRQSGQAVEEEKGGGKMRWEEYVELCGGRDSTELRRRAQRLFTLFVRHRMGGREEYLSLSAENAEAPSADEETAELFDFAQKLGRIQREVASKAKAKAKRQEEWERGCKAGEEKTRGQEDGEARRDYLFGADINFGPEAGFVEEKHEPLDDLYIEPVVPARQPQQQQSHFPPQQQKLQHDPPPTPGVGSGAAGAEELMTETDDAVAWLMAQTPLALQVLEILQTTPADAADELQSRMFDLLGESAFELMAVIMERADQLRAAAADPSLLALAEEHEAGSGQSERARPIRSRPAPRSGPALASQITVQTQAEKEADRRDRRDQRRQRRQRNRGDNNSGNGNPNDPNGNDDGAWLYSLGVEGQPEYSATDFRGTGQAHFRPGAGGSHNPAMGATGGVGKVERRNFPNYEEVSMAAPPRPPAPQDGDGRVPVEALDEFAQAAFPGTKYLNKMQSEVFDTAYNTNENILVCAPTGAGKTNVAMLALLHLFLNSGGADGSDPGECKAIYVAPMKALAQEVVAKFSERLAPLSLTVREFTGDMQLTRQEVQESHLIVTTPEKWDVISRKGGDGSLVSLVKLIILDEVHLLADDRGSVIESIVARVQRLVESSQSMVRLVGLSATLPNYEDVASFLRVNPARGLFFFGGEYRPVPLAMDFVGVTEKNRLRAVHVMNKIAYDKVTEALRHGKQAMIFVHSRRDTGKTIDALREIAAKEGGIALFAPNRGSPAFQMYYKQAQKSRNEQVRKYVEEGFGIHHAGMLRQDRTLTERMFEKGLIRVLCCTATLAWGVNLPAHTVVVKGTEVYDPERGGWTDLSMLDVMQIFGRAGRPQYDTAGRAILITPHASLNRYLSLLGHQAPIESNFIKTLADHLNAEIVGGTVTNIDEAIAWLTYTYLYVRMVKNPIMYGVPYQESVDDPQLVNRRRQLIQNAARMLDEVMMVRYEPRSGNLAVTDMGRVASHFYLKYQTMEQFNAMLHPNMTAAEALHVLSSANEFESLKVRPEELPEVDRIRPDCQIDILGQVEDYNGKVNVLLQAYVNANVRLQSFTLISDTNYICQNAARVSRALFEICLRKGWSGAAKIFLDLSKSIDKRVWWWQTPLRQFVTGAGGSGDLTRDVLRKLDDRVGPDVDRLLDMESREVGQLIRNVRAGSKVISLVHCLPHLGIEPSVQPVTRGILRVTLTLEAQFRWVDRWHGFSQGFWIWVEDGEYIFHQEYFLLKKRNYGEPHTIAFTIPVRQPLPPQYYVYAVSDQWVGCETCEPVSFQHLILPERYPPHTDLLNLHPLPRTALNEPRYEALYENSFSHFNPIQTQLFHVLYHTDKSVLLGAPTGSGKTIVAELAILRMLSVHGAGGGDAAGRETGSEGAAAATTAPAAAAAATQDSGGGGGRGRDARPRGQAKAVYIAPLKALARERVRDWQRKFKPLGLTVLELSGDVTPDVGALQRADILITTPEKWDGVTRNWKQRNYVTAVRVLIIDEIHLLGEDRGPVLEVIVSRMRYISEQTSSVPCRFVGLSTALANPKDLADWLGIDSMGMYNFRPSVRPIPMTIHIQGFPGKHYCPRMKTMNKPTFAAIMEHSPTKPALVFVASRRQTRLTALDLISFCAAQDNPKQFLHVDDEREIESIAATVRDRSLRDTLLFGVGIHHAGLSEHDRSVSEDLFVSGKIQVLVCTSTLAWGVNFPAHLVVVKGTEFFDGKTGRYVDFPITDVLQMIGRAGRPQFDDSGVACVLVHEPKKNFYRKFLHEPFPVESSLRDVLHNHFNAEIAGGTIASASDAVDYLRWTYFYRRLLVNPSYYFLDDAGHEAVEAYLVDLVDAALRDLEAAGAIEIDEAAGLEAGHLDASSSSGARIGAVRSTTLGHITSYYYIDYKSGGLFARRFEGQLDGGSGGDDNSRPRIVPTTSMLLEVPQLCKLLSDAEEFAELPVRHNEDELNAQLAEQVPWPVDRFTLDDPHTKAFLLLQGHICRRPMPIADYINDTKSVLDQAMRVLNAMIDVASDGGLLGACLNSMLLAQLILQARTPLDSELQQLPNMGPGSSRSGGRSGVQNADSGFGESKGGGGGEDAGNGDPELNESEPVRALRQATKASTLWELAQVDLRTVRRAINAVLPPGKREECVRYFCCLPLLSVEWTLLSKSGEELASGDGPAEVQAEQLLKLKVRVRASCPLDEFIKRESEREALQLFRGGGGGGGNSRSGSGGLPRPSTRVHTPKYHKPKDYGWWIVCGFEDKDEPGVGPQVEGDALGELLAVKRVGAISSGRAKPLEAVLNFEAPPDTGSRTMTLRVVSDCISGLDTMAEIRVTVVPAQLEGVVSQSDVQATPAPML